MKQTKYDVYRKQLLAEYRKLEKQFGVSSSELIKPPTLKQAKEQGYRGVELRKLTLDMKRALTQAKQRRAELADFGNEIQNAIKANREAIESTGRPNRSIGSIPEEQFSSEEDEPPYEGTMFYDLIRDLIEQLSVIHRITPEGGGRRKDGIQASEQYQPILIQMLENAVDEVGSEAELGKRLVKANVQENIEDVIYGYDASHVITGASNLMSVIKGGTLTLEEFEDIRQETQDYWMDYD